jgi:hypothetical protein
MDYDRDFRHQPLHAATDFQAVNVRHHQIGDEDVRPESADGFDRVTAVRNARDHVAVHL